MGSQARRLRRQAGVAGERYQAELRRAARARAAALTSKHPSAGPGLVLTESEAAQRLGVELAGGDLPTEGLSFAVDGREVTVVADPPRAEPETPPAPREPGMRPRPRAHSLLALSMLVAMGGLGPFKGDR